MEGRWKIKDMFLAPLGTFKLNQIFELPLFSLEDGKQHLSDVVFGAPVHLM